MIWYYTGVRVWKEILPVVTCTSSYNDKISKISLYVKLYYFLLLLEEGGNEKFWNWQWLQAIFTIKGIMENQAFNPSLRYKNIVAISVNRVLFIKKQQQTKQNTNMYMMLVPIRCEDITNLLKPQLSMILDRGKTSFPRNLLAVGRVDLLRTSISSRSAAVADTLNSWKQCIMYIGSSGWKKNSLPALPCSSFNLLIQYGPVAQYASERHYRELNLTPDLQTYMGRSTLLTPAQT